MSNPASVQPAALQRPKPSHAVLADSEAQWMFTEEELATTPSVRDGMSMEDERERRTKGINFIMQVGMMLKLPQLTLSTASVYFHRFLMRHSLLDKAGQKALHQYQIAATSVLIASKTEENIRKMKELIVACCRVAQKNPSLVVDEQSKDFWKWRDSILFHEDIVLETLCFDLTIDSPHRILFGLLKALSVENNKKLRNAAWAFINDSSMTMLCLLFPPRVIAASAIYCAAKHCSIDPKFPDCNNAQGQPWYEVNNVKWTDIKKGVNYMADLYEKNPKLAGGEASIYVGLRTPISKEDEDLPSEVDDKDNMLSRHVSQEPASPGEWTGPDETVHEPQVGSEKNLKREREEEIKPSAEPGEPDKEQHTQASNENTTAIDEHEREIKKPKTQSNGTTVNRKASASAPKSAAADAEEGSEEGEVEE